MLEHCINWLVAKYYRNLVLCVGLALIAGQLDARLP